MTVELRSAVALISSGPYRREIADEVDGLERAGQPVLLVCLDQRLHDHEPGRADVVHVPLLSAAVASSVVRRLARDPGRVLGRTFRALQRLPLAVHLAEIFARRGVTSVQGLDVRASRLASVVVELSNAQPPDLAELPVDWSRLGAKQVGLRWYARRINSIVAEVSLDGGDQRLIVKRQRSHSGGTAAERFERESNVLEELGKAMNGGTLGVPRVLVSDEANAMLVMERAAGTSLDLLFAEAAADRRTAPRLVDGIRGAGGWLASMQAATRRDAEGRPLLAELVSTAKEEVATVAERDRGIRRHRHTVIRRLDELHRGLAAGPLIVSGQHDDFWPANVFFDGTRVTVIDFESFREGLPLEDAAWFLIRAELLRRRFRLPLPDLRGHFFEGYSPGRQPDGDALSLFTMTRGLRALARGAGEDLPLPQRLWTRRTIRNQVIDAATRRT